MIDDDSRLRRSPQAALALLPLKYAALAHVALGTALILLLLLQSAPRPAPGCAQAIPPPPPGPIRGSRSLPWIAYHQPEEIHAFQNLEYRNGHIS